MKNQRIRVLDLAAELGMSARELVQVARENGFNVIRAAATLSSGQEHRLREIAVNMRRSRRALAENVAAVRAAHIEKERQEELVCRVCTCCEFPFIQKAPGGPREMCSECVHHFQRPGESYVQTLTRHEEHVAQAKKRLGEYRAANKKLSRERDEAYAKRNKWMAALVEIIVAHGPSEEQDGCECGAPEYPCLTRRHLKHANKGIYNRCEELEQLNEDEFNKILYGTDYSFFKDWEDGAA